MFFSVASSGFPEAAKFSPQRVDGHELFQNGYKIIKNCSFFFDLFRPANIWIEKFGYLPLSGSEYSKNRCE